MAAIETILWQATAPGSGGATASVATGDTAVVRGAPGSRGAVLVSVVWRTQAAGWVRVTRASGHDLVRGWQASAPAGLTRVAIVPGRGVPSVPGEAVGVTIAGSGTAGQIERVAVTLWYEQLGAIEAALVGYDDLVRQAGREVTVEITLSAGTAGGWSGEVALNAQSDLLRADRRYAVLGAWSSVESVWPSLRGPGLGGLRVVCPPGGSGYPCSDVYFLELSRVTGLPTVPVVSGSDRPGWLVGCSADQAGGSPRVTLYMVEVGG